MENHSINGYNLEEDTNEIVYWTQLSIWVGALALAPLIFKQYNMSSIEFVAFLLLLNQNWLYISGQFAMYKHYKKINMGKKEIYIKREALIFKNQAGKKTASRNINI